MNRRREPSQEEIEELNFLTDSEREQKRELALLDLWYFATDVLFPDTALTHYHGPLHDPICSWVRDAPKGARKLLLMPRGHRKTYLVTVAHAIWRIIRDPNVRILLISALDDTASRFCEMVKRQFQYNQHFLSVFPEFRVPQNVQFGRTYDFTHPLRTHHNLIDPTFRSFYLGAPVAGRRCDIAIADDPIEKRHVTTPEQADKALKDFNDLIPVIDKTGNYNMMFVVGTRWAFNDIYGALLGEDRGVDANPDVTATAVFDSIVRHCLEDADGNAVDNPLIDGAPILPTVWSRELLLQELEQYRMDPKRGEEDWWKQYMNVCISPSGRKFEESYFETWIERLPGGIVFSAMLIDSATKDEQILMRGDFTVCHVVHFDSYGHLYVTDGFRSDKFKGTDLINELISMHQRCRDSTGISVTNMVKEKVGEDTFFGWVRSEFNRARIPLTVFPLKVRGQGRKNVRIVEALQHPFMARQVHFVTTYPRSLHRVLVDEATHLGQWSHDDAIDALSLAFHPDVRVKPRTNSAYPWKAPHSARLHQLSTAETTPAAFQPQRAETATPVAWSTKSSPRADPEGRNFRHDDEGQPRLRVVRSEDAGKVTPVRLHLKE